MKLTLLKGTSEASDLLQRQDPLDMDAISSTVIQRTEEVFGAGVSPAQSVVKIIEEVRQNGDEAVLKYARMFDDPDIAAGRASVVPMGRVAKPEEIAEGCIFLLSDRSKFITGINLPIDGGQVESKMMHTPGRKWGGKELK